MVGVAGPQFAVDLIDLALEVLDQPKAGVDGAAPRLRDLQAVEQLAAYRPRRGRSPGTVARSRSASSGCGA
jgi:hypothetical protein